MLKQQALLNAVAAERYTRQIISVGTSTAIFDNAAGATSINIPWPAAGSVAANVLNVLTIALKPGTANLGNVPTPAGWTFVGSKLGGGWGGALGVNQGNAWAFMFMKTGDNTAAGSLNVPVTPDGANGVCIGSMGRLEKSKLSLVWQPVVVATGEATVNGVNVASFTQTPALKVSRGDVLMYSFAITEQFLGGTSVQAGTGLTPQVPSQAIGCANNLGFKVNSVGTSRRATRGVNPIDTPWTHTAPVGVNNRGPVVMARFRVR